MFDTPINFTNKFEIRGARDSGNTGSIEVYDGTDAWIDVSSSFGSYSQAYDYPRVNITSSITSPVKGIRFNGVSAVYQPRFTQIYVDDKILIDGDTSNMGLHGFYLPMDGNSPVGKDQSGRGNDWTPVNFGGSVTLDNPTVSGAIPILNTNDAGTVAKLGVRTDKKTYTVTASGGNYYLDGALKPTLNAYRGGTYIFDYTGATSHPFYLSSLSDGKWNSKAYSVQFDGTGDYLGVTGTSDVQFGTGAFTAECFVYANSLPGSGVYGIFDTGSAVNANRFSLVLYPSGKIYIDNNTNLLISTHVLTPNTWNHIAFVREGTGTNEAKLYINGVLSNQATINTDFSNDDLLIGKTIDNLGWNGYISNVRIVKGRAVYTSNFTPPTTTLTNVSNTTLLCCQDSNAATGVVVPNGVSITANGNAAATNSKNPFLYNSNGDFGVNTGTSNTTKITIPHLAADTLYYYCNAHSGMGSSINVTTDIRKADPYAWKNVLAVPFVGSTDDVSAELSCTSTTKTNSLTNSPTSSSLGNFYRGSREFVGSNGQRINYANSAQFDFGASDFTVEGWYYHQTKSVANTVRRYFAHTEHNWDGNRWIIYTSFTGNVDKATFYTHPTYSTNGGAPHLIGTTTFAVGNWYHIAVTRSGNTFRLFVNGILEDSANSSTSVGDSANNIQIGGGSGQTDRTLYGNVQDVRIYKGVAKYTENFVVGSTTPDVLPDTPSGITGKTNLTKITDGAVFIDRSNNEYLQAGQGSTDFRLDGQYCIEYFLNLTDYSNDSVYVRTFVLDGPTGDGGTTNIHLNVNPSTGVLLFWSGSGELISGTISIVSDWHHVCLTRDSSNKTRLFIDGVLSGSADITTDYDPNSGSPRPRLGALGNTGGTSGYYSNWRIIKGSIPTEYQTSTTTNGTKVFDSPTEALTTTSQGATANHVKLIACQSNTEPGGAAVAPSIGGPNNGTQWSSKVTPGSEFRSGYGAGNAFDGNSVSNINGTTACEINKVSFVEFDFGSGIPFTTLQMQCDDNNEGTVKVNGVDITNQLPTGSFTNTTINGVTSPLKKIRLDAVNANASSVYLGSITIDGVMLRDPLTRNGEVVATNFNPFTDNINTIRGQETGYATLNPLLKGASTTLSNGNLTVSSSGSTFDGFATGTITIPKTGKWFVEFTAGSLPSSTYYGMYNTRTWNPNGFGGTGFFGLQADTGRKFKSTGQSDYGSAVSLNDVVGVMYDADNNTIAFMRNGVNYGVAFDSSDGIDYTDDHRVWWNTNASTSVAHTINFGQKPFKFPPPDGFQPLSLSTVQPEKVFARPEQYIGTTLYTGSGETVSPRTIELPHAADLVWAKSRDRGSSHQIADTVRGDNSVLNSNTNMTARNPTTSYNGGGISTIDGKTISLVKGSTNQANNENLNATGQRGVVWSWKAGGSKGQFNIDDVGYANASDVNMNVGALNDYNDDEIWSSGLSGSGSGGGWASGEGPTAAFDGDTDTRARWTGTSSGVITATLPTAISATKLRVKGHFFKNSSTASEDVMISVNGGTYVIPSDAGLTTFAAIQAAPGNNLFIDCSSLITGGQVSSVSIKRRSTVSSASGLTIYAIEVDDKILVDSNQTPPNIPSVPNTGCSVGTKQGFSIIAYNATGSNLTVNHGLSERPGFILLKTVHSTSGDWLVWHQSLDGVDRFLKLNDNSVPQSQASNVFISMDENTFGTGNDAGINSANQEKIAYIWHDVPGLQKFGIWYGNGSTDGPFIETGFTPAIILYKDITGTGFWNINDSARTTYNELTRQLYPATSDVENHHNSNRPIDFLSNGFKIRSANGAINDANKRYVYAAWAEAPSINLYGAQSNAF